VIAITAIRTSGNYRHDQITEVSWLDTSDGQAGKCSVATMVGFIDKGNSRVAVGGPERWVMVGVVRPAGRSPYIRTYADGEWNDNLLALPKYS
jgi:hypothetical protein